MNSPTDQRIAELTRKIADIGVEYGTESMENGGFDEQGYTKAIQEAQQQLAALVAEAELKGRIEENVMWLNSGRDFEDRIAQLKEPTE